MEVQGPCIYRVPSRIRDVKPEAYTPRMVVIGPLHRSPKSTAIDGPETSSTPWHLKKEYIKMEVTKKTYIESYTQRVGQDTIEEMRKTIQAEEVNLRASYEESTEWIPSQYFVELILQDSVFIMEFFLRFMQRQDYSDDKIVHMPFYSSMVRHDLVLLENQLPYFILDRLFSSSMVELYMRETLDQFILCNFGLTMEEKTNFRHFTDMFRCVYEESLDDIPKQMNTYPNRWPPITELRNADNLFQAGVDFKSSDILIQTYEKYEASERKHGPGILQRTMTVVHKERPVRKRDRIPGFSLDVEFENGILTMPGFHANEVSDMYLRNVVAFEQCHVSVIPFTSNYIHFLNFLISFDRDVEVLIEEGVVTNTMGRLSLVVDMVNKLQVGVKVGTMSQYHDISMKLKAHYKSRRKRCWATLNKVYFSDLWTGTATIAAVLLLFMTLVGTVASVIQTYKSF